MLYTNQLAVASFLIFTVYTAFNFIDPGKIIMMGTVAVAGYQLYDRMKVSEKQELERIESTQASSSLIQKYVKYNSDLGELLTSLTLFKKYDVGAYTKLVDQLTGFLKRYYKLFMAKQGSVKSSDIIGLVEERDGIITQFEEFSVKSSKVSFSPEFTRCHMLLSQILFNYLKSLENKHDVFVLEAASVQKKPTNSPFN